MPVQLRHLLLACLAALLVAVTAGCAGYGSSGRVSLRDGNTRLDLAFSSQERQVIHDFYRRHLPPGLAKRAVLPPGLAKRAVLPPGLTGERLPRELESRLERLPEGYVRLRLGTDIVLMNARTRLVFDVIQNIGR